MGKFILPIDKTEDQQYLKQNVDMLIGRIKTGALITADKSGVISAVSINSASYTDVELEKMWKAVKSANPQRKNLLIPDDSPLRRLNGNFSRKQALLFDGIRYAAEMADIAYWRMFDLLQEMSSLPTGELTTRQIATVMLDVWSIVDSVNRLRHLLEEAKGVDQGTWWKLFFSRTKDIDCLRNDIQHLKERLQLLVSDSEQIWGFLSWAEIHNGKYTGVWHMMSPGAVYQNDEWIYAGPTLPSVPLPFGRIRLHAYGKKVYLGKILKAVHDMVAELTEAIHNGSARPMDIPAIGRNGGDIMYSSSIEAKVDGGKVIILTPDVGL